MAYRYTSDELNEKIAALDDREDVEYEPIGHGKPVFYYGWYWRRVDFDRRIHLCTDHDGTDAGFCENNKWGYLGFVLDEEQSARLRAALEDAVDEPDETHLNAVHQLMQDFRPIKASR